MSVEIVDSVQQAVSHVNMYGSGHTDCIVTESRDNARLFTQVRDDAAAAAAAAAALDCVTQGVDSACTFVNASRPPPHATII